MPPQVEFDEVDVGRGAQWRQSSAVVQKTPFVYALFIRQGLAKDEKSARNIALALALVLLTTSFVIFYFFVLSDASKFEKTRRYFPVGKPYQNNQ